MSNHIQLSSYSSNGYNSASSKDQLRADLLTIQSLALGAKNGDEMRNGGLGRIGMTKNGEVYKFSTSAFGRTFNPTTKTMREDCDRLREHLAKLLAAFMPKPENDINKAVALDHYKRMLGVSSAPTAKKPLLDRKIVAQAFNDLNEKIVDYNDGLLKDAARDPRLKDETLSPVSVTAEEIKGYDRHHPMRKISNTAEASKGESRPKAEVTSDKGAGIELVYSSGAAKVDKKAATEQVRQIDRPQSPEDEEWQKCEDFISGLRKKLINHSFKGPDGKVISVPKAHPFFQIGPGELKEIMPNISAAYDAAKDDKRALDGLKTKIMEKIQAVYFLEGPKAKPDFVREQLNDSFAP